MQVTTFEQKYADSVPSELPLRVVFQLPVKARLGTINLLVCTYPVGKQVPSISKFFGIATKIRIKVQFS